MPQRFVILAMQRTGSNMLVSALNSHPEITCLGELFRPTPKWMLCDGYRGALKILNEISPIYRDVHYRVAHPEPYLEEVFQQCAGCQIQGFKLMLSQAPKFVSEIIKDQNYTKILLRRNNVLASYSSTKIAEKTGQGNARQSDKILRTSVVFDAREFVRFKNVRDKLYKSAAVSLTSAGQPFLELEYLELTKGERFAEVVAFLGADARIRVEPGTAKRNPSNLLDRFENPEDVKRFLQKNNLTHWTHEE